MPGTPKEAQLAMKTMADQDRWNYRSFVHVVVSTPDGRIVLQRRDSKDTWCATCSQMEMDSRDTYDTAGLAVWTRFGIDRNRGTGPRHLVIAEIPNMMKTIKIYTFELPSNTPIFLTSNTLIKLASFQEIMNRITFNELDFTLTTAQVMKYLDVSNLRRLWK